MSIIHEREAEAGEYGRVSACRCDCEWQVCKRRPHAVSIRSPCSEGATYWSETRSEGECLWKRNIRTNVHILSVRQPSPYVRSTPGQAAIDSYFSTGLLGPRRTYLRNGRVSGASATSSWTSGAVTTVGGSRSGGCPGRTSGALGVASNGRRRPAGGRGSLGRAWEGMALTRTRLSGRR
ncbi:hypothetical protein BD413DRAFT_185978 [Trametes elegans]|nr:hypothetical protein BD413DRAFT_185978 [Trametes elegans]